MPRGCRPLFALGEAKHIAEKRGEIRHFRHEPDMICNFVIYMMELIAHVRIRRVERICITPDWLEREAADDLAALRFIASSPEISRELWVCTPNGTFRFFRVLAHSLAEPDRYGQLMPDQVPVPHRRKTQTDPAPAAAGEPGSPGSGDSPAGPVMDATFFFRSEAPSGSVDQPTGTVGENTLPERRTGAGERFYKSGSFCQTEPESGGFAKAAMAGSLHFVLKSGEFRKNGTMWRFPGP